MFNLKDYSSPQQEIPDAYLLKQELDVHDIKIADKIVIRVGDHFILADSVSESIDLLNSGIKELKETERSLWEDLSNLVNIIPQNNAGNKGSIDNLLFLSNVQKSYFLSKRFSELKNVSHSIKNLLSIDAASTHPDLIRKFNQKSLEIFLLHRIIMGEIYKSKLLKKYSLLTKTAQISGPWANLDLPMQERVWEFSEDADYFDNRERSRKNQTRYNPENGKSGFYYVYQDLNRDPYLFEDRKDESPYPSRNTMMIS